jgi:hypothetical protein
VRPLLAPFVDHPLRLRCHEIEQGIATHIHEATRPEQRFDLLSRPAAEERELVADRRVLRARAGTPRRWRGSRVELTVQDDQAPSRDGG